MTQSNRAHLIVTLVYSVCFIALELKGIRHRNETTFARMTKVSMAGGLEFFVDGKGLDAMPSINQVQYTTLQGAQPVMMIGKPLDSKCFFELKLPSRPKVSHQDFTS